MSDSGSDGPGRREVAHRLFAAEFEDADLSYSESDEERAPNYVVTPSGARVNRLFVVGVLTEVEQVSEDVLRGRVVDPTGAFVLYAGQYQPDEQAFLDRAEPPIFVAVTGKARTFQPDDADTVYTSVRPETISEVDADTRDRWTVDAAERTRDRVGTFAAAARMEARGDDLAAALRERGVDDSLAEGVALALDHYGTTGSYLAALRELALDAARVVAGQREEVESLTADPSAGDDGPLDALAADLEGADATTETAGPAGTEAEPEAATASPSTADADTEGKATAASASPTASAEPAESSGSAESSEDAETAGVSEAAEPSEPAESSGTTGSGTAGTAATVESATEPDTGPEGTESGTGTDAVDADVTDEPGEADEVGDFEGGGLEGDESEDLEDFEPEEFELDEEEREEIEEEYGTDFQSGTEIEEPGEADIDTPEAESDTADVESGTTEAGPGAPETGSEATEHGGEQDPGAAPDSESETEPTGEAEPEPEPGSESETDTGTEPEGEPLEGEDLEDAVVDLMANLDEGEGVDREELVGAATERYGADTSAVEDAIQDALMGGRCYEPDDGTLKPI